MKGKEDIVFVNLWRQQEATTMKTNEGLRLHHNQKQLKEEKEELEEKHKT